MLSGPGVGLCTREPGAGRPCFHRLPLALLDISETRKLYLKMTKCAVFVREERVQRGVSAPQNVRASRGHPAGWVGLGPRTRASKSGRGLTRLLQLWGECADPFLQGWEWSQGKSQMKPGWPVPSPSTRWPSEAIRLHSHQVGSGLGPASSWAS